MRKTRVDSSFGRQRDSVQYYKKRDVDSTRLQRFSLERRRCSHSFWLFGGMKTCLLILLAFVTSFSAESQDRQKRYVLIVSFDGFRYDYVQRLSLPNLQRFINDGAHAEGLIPCFPSKTFPNHYSIVTGLYPGHHGLVDNQFYDPLSGESYSMRNREAVTEPSFYGGTPLWVLAREQGVKTASYFWVGSEVSDESRRPHRYLPYQHDVPFSERIDSVLQWLRIPDEERPQLITLYFSSPDSESHQYGPFAPATLAKVHEMDSLLGVLVAGVEATGLPVNVVVVSDHGMSSLTQERDTFIFVEDLGISNNEGTVVVNGGTQIHIYNDAPAVLDSIYAALEGSSDDFSVFRSTHFPERWNYNHPRSGGILLAAAPGKYFVSGDRERFRARLSRGQQFGAHGYDPDLVTDMHGIFYALGPDIKAGKKIPAFRNVHVYPFIAHLLGLKYGPVDGDLSVLEPVLKK